MIEVKKEGVLLSKTNLEFENEGVLNPAIIRIDDNVHMFYRAVSMGNYSSIGYCRLDGPLSISERWEKPFMVPEFEYESHGVEDPRIVKIDDLYICLIPHTMEQMPVGRMLHRKIWYILRSRV